MRRWAPRRTVRALAASAPSELFDEQHPHLIVELSGVRDGQLDTHGESRPREGFHVQAGHEGDLGPVVLGDGGRGRAELDERGEPSGHRPGGCKPGVELLSVLGLECPFVGHLDRKSTRLNSSHITISYAVFCLKKKKKKKQKKKITKKTVNKKNKTDTNITN